MGELIDLGFLASPEAIADAVTSTGLDATAAEVARDEAETAAAAAAAVGATSDAQTANNLTAGPLTTAALANTIADEVTPLITPKANAADVYSKASANAAFSKPRGNTIVLAGDSRINQESEGSDSGASFSYLTMGAFSVANVLLRHRFNVLNNAGVVGNTSTQLLARYATDVLAYAPQNVFLGIGVNDVTNNIPTATSMANIVAMFDLNDSIGATTIIQTINPKDDHSAGQRVLLAALNRWLRMLKRRNVIVIDVTTPIISDSGMTWRAGMVTDGGAALHQGRQGAARMGRAIAKTLAPLYPASDPLPLMEGDPENLLTNIWMLDSNADGLANGYATNAVGTNTIVPATDGLPGGWQQIEVAGAPASITIQRNPQSVAIPAGWAGKKFIVCVEMEFFDSTGPATNMNLNSTQRTGTTVVMESRDFRTSAGDPTTFPGELVPGLGTGPVVLCTPPQTVKPTATNILITFTVSALLGKVRFRRMGIMLAD